MYTYICTFCGGCFDAAAAFAQFRFYYELIADQKIVSVCVYSSLKYVHTLITRITMEMECACGTNSPEKQRT